jgi:soluble lytic murein transglycosylase-like protein
MAVRVMLVLIAAVALTTPANARQSSWRVDRWQREIAEASRRFDLSEAWISAVVTLESGGRTEIAGKPIVSKAGALGLMQVMPATYSEMRSHYSFGIDPHNPVNNILAGSAYLRLMYDRFGYPNCFAAYNAGPTRILETMFAGRPLPLQTQRYVGLVKTIIDQRTRRWQQPEFGTSLFMLTSLIRLNGNDTSSSLFLLKSH